MMARHACVHTFPIESWERVIPTTKTDSIQSWVDSVESRNRNLLRQAYYRAYYRICRRELARRGLGT